MRLSEALPWARTIGISAGEAEMLLEFLLRKSREYIIAHPEHEISREEILQFQKYCDARAKGIPMAYLTHHKEFFGLDFYVDERVLIPRPETEMLVEEAILRQQDTGNRKQVWEQGTGKGVVFCDIGTGSGCIAIALAKNLPHARIIATDISADAIEVAKKNAEFHGVSSQIEFMKSDLLSEISSRSFDGIIANLPYIGITEHHFVSKEVLEHEPHGALFSGENGLDLYERLFTQIRALLKPPGWFIGEIGFLQQEDIEKLIRQYFGTISLTFKNDLSNLPRMFSILFNK